jgi:hypothetical protein
MKPGETNERLARIDECQRTRGCSTEIGECGCRLALRRAGVEMGFFIPTTDAEVAAWGSGSTVVPVSTVPPALRDPLAVLDRWISSQKEADRGDR